MRKVGAGKKTERLYNKKREGNRTPDENERPATSKKPPRHGEGPSRFKGEGQHGWAPDVDETSQQPNPSAHRPFNPDTYAPEPDRPRRKPSEEEKRASLEGTTTESSTSRGEDRGKDSDMQDTGRRGKSRRPSGEKDASAHTGVDPQERKGGDPSH